MIDDDRVWTMRHRRKGDVIAALPGNRSTISSRLWHRGWRWYSTRSGTDAIGVSHAPCRGCDESVPVEELTDGRVCANCDPAEVEAEELESLTVNQRLAREEYERRKDRIGTPEWNRKYMRPGGPEWSPIRGAA